MSKYCTIPIYHFNLDYSLSKYKLIHINYSIINILYKVTEKKFMCHHLMDC